MLKTILRLSAALAAPFALAGATQAQVQADYGYYEPGQAEEVPLLILYSGENFSGEVREIYDPIYALPDLRFNDRARSVAVLSGQWEVCEHSDFTGRCVFLRYDVPDLGWFGLSREISSVRPVYEYTEAEHGLMFVRDRNGYIRYADNARYGYDNYSYGYGVSTRIQVYHYGYSPDYRRYGYYDPRLGYDPYGFGWHGGYGGYYNTSSYYRRERPPLRGHYGARDGAVTLYVDSNGRGPSFGLNREIRDLSRYRFNDNVSSISIRSGRWEVCEHANFQGRCQIIDASVDKLNGFRLNDNISSIRPVGGSGDARWDRRDRGDRDGRRDSRGDGPRDGSRDGRRDGDTRRDGRPGGGLPPALANARSAAAAPAGTAPAPGAATSPVTRRTGEVRQDRRREPALAGGLPNTPAMRARADTARPQASRTLRTKPVGTPEKIQQPTREVRREAARTEAPRSRTSTPPAMRRIETSRPRDVRPAATPQPQRAAPATRPARTRTPAAPAARSSAPPVRTQRAAPPAPAPRASAPQPAPAPRAAPQRDTRPPALRSRDRPTRNQD